MKLREITDQHKELLKLKDEGVDIADTMEAIDGDFEKKALSLYHVSNEVELDIETVNSEIKRLQSRMKVMTNNRDRMREYLRFNMEESGITKIECPLFTITLAKGKDMVQIQDEDKLPTDYLDISVTSRPMKKEMLSDMKEGKEIPGAIMVKSKSSLRIK